jgi:PiT family inorganic phosphate transporter
MNDAANAVATVVASKAFTPHQAIALARTLNLLGALLTTRVAHTIGRGIVAPELLEQQHLLAALVGAITWAALCTFVGLPISITHALIGGLVGPALVQLQPQLVSFRGVTTVLLTTALAPAAGLVAGHTAISLVHRTKWLATPEGTQRLRWGQLLSASFVALTHGANDSQNAMGIITAALLAVGYLDAFRVPLWVKVGSAVFMALGTWAGGWRVIDTVGRRLVTVDTAAGFAAETGSSLVIAFVTWLGIPISTTHVVSAAVLGTGTGRPTQKVDWAVARELAVAWMLTLPGSAAAAAVTYALLGLTVYS